MVKNRGVTSRMAWAILSLGNIWTITYIYIYSCVKLVEKNLKCAYCLCFPITLNTKSLYMIFNCEEKLYVYISELASLPDQIWCCFIKKEMCLL